MICQITLRNISDDSHLHILRRENLKSHTSCFISISVFFSILSFINERQACYITSLSVRLCFPLITREQFGRFSWILAGRLCRWRWPRQHNFKSHNFNHFKMADVQTSDVDTKPALVSRLLSRVKFGDRGNQTIVLSQLKPYLWNNLSHSWTDCLTNALTVIGSVTMETKSCSLL
jgi:hypothetical protein